MSNNINKQEPVLLAEQARLNLLFDQRLDDLIEKAAANGVDTSHIAASFYIRVVNALSQQADDEDFIQSTIDNFTDTLQSAVTSHKETTKRLKEQK